MKIMLLLFLFLPLLPSLGKESGNRPKDAPVIEVTAGSLYIPCKDRENHRISLSLDCFLKDKGTFTEQEGPHHLTLSDPQGTWNVPLEVETEIYTKNDPLAWKVQNIFRLPTNSTKDFRLWTIHANSLPFYLLPSTTKFRIRGTLVFYIAPRMHTLPPFDLLQDGKGYTLDIPLPDAKEEEEGIAISGMQDTATFTSSSPAEDTILTLKYNSARFQFAHFLLQDQQGHPAKASPARCFPVFSDLQTHEFSISRQYYSKQDWNLFRVQLLYVNPAEAQRVTVPVDMEVSLAAQPSDFRREPEQPAFPVPSIAPDAQQRPTKKIHFHIKSIGQDRRRISGGFFTSVPSTTIDLFADLKDHAPVPLSLSLEGPLLLKGDGAASSISFSSHFSTDFTFSKKGEEAPELSLHIPGLLPPTSSCWTLSGSIKATMASHVCRISMPFPLTKGNTVTLPAEDIPSGVLPENEKIRLTISDVKQNSPDIDGSLLVYVRSSLPPESFGALTLIDSKNSRYNPIFPDKTASLPQGVTAVYKVSFPPADRQITAELVLYINPHTVTIPLHLKFGAGGIIPSP